MFLSKKSPLIAIDIGSSSIKLVQLRELKRGKYELAHFGIMPLTEECIVEGLIKKPELVAEALNKLIKTEKIQSNYAVSSVAGESVFTKKIKVPVMSKEELSKRITNNTQNYIPFDIDDVALDFEILSTIRADEEEGFKTTEQVNFLHDSQDNDVQVESSDDSIKMRDFMEVLLVAVKKNTINERSNILKAAGLKPVIIDLDVFALMNAARLTKDLSSMGNVALVDLGDSFTHINIIQGGAVHCALDIPIGGGYLTNVLMSKFKVPFEQILAIKRGKFSSDIKEDEVIEAILEAHKKVLKEIKKYFEYFIILSNHQIERVFLCGGGSMIRGIDGFFNDYLKIPVETLDPMQGIKVNPKKFNQSLINEMSSLYGVALGLATRRFDYI